MILRHTCRIRSRGGFTLVELMVAAALSVTIMWILAESFKMGIDFARTARSTGDMMTQLNNAGQIINRDLTANHFLVTNPIVNSNSGKLSAQTLDQFGSGNVSAVGGYTPPNGFFQIYSPPVSTSVLDNSEGFLLDTATNHSLQFTAYLPQGLPQNQFVATCPPNGQPYFSQAAEIGYFLSPPTSGPTTTPPLILTAAELASGLFPHPQGQPLFNLYRRQRLVAVTSNDVFNLQGAIQTDPTASDVISTTQLPTKPATTHINTLGDFGQAISYTVGAATNMMPASRVLPTPQTGTPLQTAGRIGDDILLSNVLSFEVLPCWNLVPDAQAPFQNAAAGVGLPVPSSRPFTVTNNTGNKNYPASNAPFNSNYPFDTLPLVNINPNAQYQYVFDTWYQISAPYPIANTNPSSINWNWNNLLNLASLPSKTIPDPPGKAINNVQNPNVLPLPIRVTALQITIRIYDPKTRQARQNTWRVAM